MAICYILSNFFFFIDSSRAGVVTSTMYYENTTKNSSSLAGLVMGIEKNRLKGREDPPLLLLIQHWSFFHKSPVLTTRSLYDGL